ncbi:MAG: gamma-glutamyltransferase [Gemmatimonadota bacterium]|nr:MAG: gamma-glutamyltransferase [Gemmatimonadota bacterium]
MVVSTNRYASEVGVGVLEAGGNAIDAAVATAFALAVVNPEAGNIGGGGFMVLRLADGSTAALDFRERAPAAASRDMYLDESGELTEGSVVGHRAVGVPGSVAGLWEAHQRYGTVAWADLLTPAIRLAEGFAVTDRAAKSLRHYAAELTEFDYTSAIFLSEGATPGIGDTLVQSDLAGTLRCIQEHGRDGFYTGETAQLFVDEMRRGGGIINTQDLASYQPTWREPIEFSYREHTIISMPPSSSGGITLALMARILDGYELSRLPWHSPQMIHLLAEAWKRAYADRNEYLGDPDFVTIPTARLTSVAYGAERRAGISLERATPASQVAPGLGPYQSDENTTHLSVVDAAGNAVSLTTTINSFYGIKAVVRGAGFFLNNEMDDFAASPGTPNMFGLVQGEANAIAPGKRMLSAMTPTIVLRPDGSLLLVLGSPGGPTIITNVFQNIMNVVDYGMNIVEAVHAPRLHHQHLPDRIDYELGSLRPATIAVLEAMGHTVNQRYDSESLYPYIGDVQAVMVLPDGQLEAVSDPRRGGAAVGF